MPTNTVSEFTWAIPRDALVEFLEGVPGIGTVHNRFRYNVHHGQNSPGTRQTRAKSPEEWAQLVTPPGEDFVHFWSVVRVGQTRTWMTGQEMTVVHNVQIHGWYQFDDELDTQSTFDAVADAVMADLQGRVRLSGGAQGDCVVEIHGPAQMPVIDHVYVGPYLCHHVQISTTTQHIVLVQNIT